MNPTRRSFVKMSTGALAMIGAGGSGLLTAGCPTLEQDIEHWVPLGISALTGIQNLLGPIAAPFAPIINNIKTGFSDLLAATEEYANDTNPADKANAVAKIQTALNDITANFENLFNQLPGGAIVELAFGLAQIVLSTIAGFIGQLPAMPATVTMRKTFTVKGQTITITPVLRTKRAFKKVWNSAVDAAGHSNLEMHVYFWEHA
jgi:hypothetical protein